MIKVTFLAHSLPSGGTENVFLRTLPKIKNIEATVLTLREKGYLFSKYLAFGIEAINIGQKSFFDLSSYFRTLRILRNIKPDLIITSQLHSDIFGRFFLQLFGFKVVPYLQTTYNFRKYWPARIFERTTKYFVPQYLANSCAVKNFYVKKYSIEPAKIFVIPNGVDLEKFNIETNHSFNESIGLKDNHTIIVCVANFSINKGHEFLILAFARISKHYKAQLVLVGDGKEKQNLMKLVKSLSLDDSVLFLGKRDDVSKILRSSDIFVLPTFFEGMSNAIMEAMASKLPIITTDIPENQELIQDGKTGLLCPIKNSVCLAEKIKLLTGDNLLGKRLGTEAYEKIKKEYNLDIIIRKWEKYFE